MGSQKILTLNLQTLQYEPRKKPKFATLEMAKPIDDLKTRLKTLVTGQDKAGEFYRQLHYSLFSYISHRIPEISDELYRVDDAMKAGFGWEIGAFESWDILGVSKTGEDMKAAGFSVAPWIEEMLATSNKSFYKTENGKSLYYDVTLKTYKQIPGTESFIILNNYKDKIVWKNSNAALYDIGDDVVALHGTQR
jgi:3-hydroxyacyl-CoA dehydrogenase